MNLQSQLEQILKDLVSLTSETTLMAGAILLLITGLFSRNELLHKLIYLAVVDLAFFFGLQVQDFGSLVSNSLVLSIDTKVYGGLMLMVSALVLIFPRCDKHSTEFYFLLLALLVGAFFTIKANNLLIIYLAVELMSFVGYLLTSFTFKKDGFEASIKYLIFGSLSSAIMLLGVGFLYGSLESIYLTEWQGGLFGEALPQLSLLLFLSGIFFKISIFPFHIWAPASYQSAPVDATAMLSIIPKLAGLVLLKRILAVVNLDMEGWLIQGILLLGILTVISGTLGALNQKNTRRMISFGAIAHSGFMLPFAVFSTVRSAEAFWWYAVAYSVMNVAAFYHIDRFEGRRVFQNEAYSRQDSVLGVTFTIVLISLVGLPPLAGFTAKFFLFSMLWEGYQQLGSNLLLSYLLIASLATIGSLFFYLRIPYHLFLAPKESLVASTNFSISTKIKATIFFVTLLLMFFVPKFVVMMHNLLKNLHE